MEATGCEKISAKHLSQDPTQNTGTPKLSKKKKTTQCVTRANDLNTHFTEDARVAIYHTKRGLPISCHQKCRPMPQRDTHGPERLRANRSQTAPSVTTLGTSSVVS